MRMKSKRVIKAVEEKAPGKQVRRQGTNRRNAKVPRTSAHKTSEHAPRLVYVSDQSAGYGRVRRNHRFRYVNAAGKEVRAANILERIRRLAIPPAYTDVWICRDARGHLQATGRDARGRKQYRYHPLWRQARDASKYHRMLAFAEQLPRLRRQVKSDLALRGLPKRKLLAALVDLLETSLIRIGNEEYAHDNGSFGLTTLEHRHVKTSGEGIHFRFRGKSGKFHSVDLKDGKIARIVRRCQELPGQSLFQFIGEHDEPENVDSDDVNAYIREIAGEDFSAKDFRTWAGTMLAARYLARPHPASSETDIKAQILAATKHVADCLGNTVAVCRACYIHPLVFEAHAAGKLHLPRPPARKPVALSADERALQRLLRRCERHAESRPS